jgi:hypothetical protein
MKLFSLSCDRLDRTTFLAEKTAHTLCGFNVIDDQIFTDKSRAAFLLDMDFILLEKIPKSCENGIGRRLSQSTKRTQVDGFGQILQLLYISLFPPALCDTV